MSSPNLGITIMKNYVFDTEELLELGFNVVHDEMWAYVSEYDRFTGDISTEIFVAEPHLKGLWKVNVSKRTEELLDAWMNR